MTRIRRPAWLAPVGVGTLGLVALGALAVLDPEQRAEFAPRCPFRLLTGFDCPGCGGTRAVHALIQGDLPLALDHNAFAVLITLPLLTVAWSMWLAARAGWRERGPTLTPGWTYTLATVITTFWIVRNLPFEPFSRLASTAVGG